MAACVGVMEGSEGVSLACVQNAPTQQGRSTGMTVQRICTCRPPHCSQLHTCAVARGRELLLLGASLGVHGNRFIKHVVQSHARLVCHGHPSCRFWDCFIHPHQICPSRGYNAGMPHHL